MDLNGLSKPQLNELLRRVNGKGVDIARTAKGELLSAVDSLPQPAVQSALQAMGLITGAFGAAPVAPVAAAPAVEQLPAIVPVGSSTLGQLFGIRGKYAAVEAQVWNDPAAPVIDPLYRFDPEQLASTVAAIARGRNVWLAGPAGTGKTEFVKNLCAGLGRAFVRVSFDSGAERYEFIGGERVRNGTTVYQHGVVLQGMTRPGAVVLLDEVSFARPEYLSALHPILEPEGCVTIPESGEVVRKAPGVVFFAADNSNGCGDFTGNYVGVREMNKAFINRFAKMIVFSYLEPAIESKVLVGRTGCTIQLAELIVSFLSVCRQAGDQAQLDHVPTLREAFYLAEAISDRQTPRKAFEEVMVNRASLESQEVLQQLWRANVNEVAIDLALDGLVLAPESEPVQQSAPEAA